MLRNWILGIILTVSPSISFAPSTMNVKLREIPPEARYVVWSLIGGDFGTSSQWDLHGEKTLFLPQWKEVPPGDYLATATVYDQAGHKLGQSTAHVLVKGPE